MFRASLVRGTALALAAEIEIGAANVGRESVGHVRQAKRQRKS